MPKGEAPLEKDRKEKEKKKVADETAVFIERRRRMKGGINGMKKWSYMKKGKSRVDV